MSAMLDAVEAILRDDDWKYLREDRDAVIRFGLTGEVHQYQCIFVADEPNRVLLLYAIAPLRVPPGSRLAVCEFLCRANYNMKLGNFEIDLADGEVRFKTSVSVEGIELGATVVRTMMSVNFHTMDDYMPGLLAVVRQGLQPSDVIAMIERVQ